MIRKKLYLCVIAISIVVLSTSLVACALTNTVPATADNTAPTVSSTNSNATAVILATTSTSIDTSITNTPEGEPTTASEPQGFLAVPQNGPGPGVLVLHAWWGLNDTTKGFCQQLADAGFTAFAPDLYHGKVADTISEAERLSNALSANRLQARDEIAQAAAFLKEYTGQADDGLAVMGFSMGANYALDLATTDTEDIRAVVLFYGTGSSNFSRSKATYLGHFAENDPYESPANVNKLEQALQSAKLPVTFYRYPGVGHWFMEPDRSDAYAPQSARLAWDRTIDFLRHYLSK